METASNLVRVSVFNGLPDRLVCPLRLAAAAWLAVFTVIFCAVVPAGLPLTAARGSAFNPATTSVALHAKAPQARLLVKRVLRPDAGDAPVVAVELPALAPVATTFRLPTSIGRLWIALVAPALGLARIHGLPWARGPPVV